jgi:hypothetical protein
MSQFHQQPFQSPDGRPPQQQPLQLQGQPPQPPQFGPFQHQTLPPKPPGQGATWWKSRPAIGAATLVLGILIGSAGGSGQSDTATASSTPTVTVSVPADGQAPAPAVTVTAPAPAAKTVQVPGPARTVTAAPPGPKVAIEEDGTWLVGTDIKPGTYRSSSDGDCYWARLKNTSGDFEAILTNGNGGNQVVTVKKTDKAFESTRCAPWTKVQ